MKYAKHVDLQIVPNFVTWPFRMLVRDFETKGGNYYRAGKGVECFWNVSCACPFENVAWSCSLRISPPGLTDEFSRRPSAAKAVATPRG